MACEKVVIATSVGGILDAVSDCENGRLVPAKDSDQLASAINELLSDNELRRKLGIAARKTIINGFSPQKELQGNLEVYRSLGLNP
jgi:glycosyltransferase involved in cell wall biosynthesis